MRTKENLAPSAAELISDCIVALENCLIAGDDVGRTLAQLVLSNLHMARERLAKKYIARIHARPMNCGNARAAFKSCRRRNETCPHLSK